MIELPFKEKEFICDDNAFFYVFYTELFEEFGYLLVIDYTFDDEINIICSQYFFEIVIMKYFFIGELW